ncbi:aryldialkylphosphatase [Clostridium sp. cel8]|jgi:5-phospho-D-xylono-1,4-lactonase|uniref:phosphotriesterase family protein n=1 Tax=Clostridium sp. cel8 TaxID=2663123 RepID=UPI0015F659D8|nr:aryldialkylphosphatase [Clostridium sp. cel8]MBA5850693.1 aryldialkylphosphatase [Clostridium sp. cel8]
MKDITYAITVLGKVDTENLGVTYSHEHLIVKPNSDDPKYYDYTLDDINKSIEETFSFKRSGGKTVVEMTPINYGRDPNAYKKISEITGVNIICCTGFHKTEFLPDFVYNSKDEDIFNLLMKEINEGIEDTGIRPGVLKIGTSFNTINDIEKKLIGIVAKAHSCTGLPVSTHCDKGTMGVEQAQLLIKNGVNPERIVLGHVDIPKDIDYVKKLCSMGVNVQIDHVGRELDSKDSFRINMINDLVADGYVKQIFISGDMGKKDYFKSYGGKPGLEYIADELKYNLVEKIGIKNFNQIMIDNPKRFFKIQKNK